MKTQAASEVVRFPVSVSLPLASTAMGILVIISCAIGYETGRRTSKMEPIEYFMAAFNSKDTIVVYYRRLRINVINLRR
jgi:hypothetical protein